MDKKKLAIISTVIILILSTARIFAAAEAPQAKEKAWYEYDKSMPLNAKVTEEKDAKKVHKIYFTFTSMNDEVVPGVITIPKSEKYAAPYPVIVMMHGFMMAKEDFINLAFQDYFAKMGIATIAIDFPMHGERPPGDPRKGFDTIDDAEKLFTQALFDVLRLLDYIETREELNADKIGYLGVSMGTIIGGIAAGIDDRIDVMAYLIGGGGLLCLFQGIDLAGSKNLGELIKNDPDKISAQFSYFDPIQYFEKISPRPVLFFNVEDDPVVKKECAENIHAAVGDPKRVIWQKAGGHVVLPMQIKSDVMGWFGKYLLDKKKQKDKKQ